MLFRDRDNHGVTAEDSMEQTITVTSPFGNTRGDHHVQSDTRRRGTQQITLQAWRPNRAEPSRPRIGTARSADRPRTLLSLLRSLKSLVCRLLHLSSVVRLM